VKVALEDGSIQVLPTPPTLMVQSTKEEEKAVDHNTKRVGDHSPTTASTAAAATIAILNEHGTDMSLKNVYVQASYAVVCGNITNQVLTVPSAPDGWRRIPIWSFTAAGSMVLGCWTHICLFKACLADFF